VDKNFSFRPYFKKAIAGKSATYLALGTTSGKRGVYYSHPVYDNDKGYEVLKFEGQSLNNGFVKGDWKDKNDAWNNREDKDLTISLKFENPFRVFVILETKNGTRYLQYTPVDDNQGYNRPMIHHALGSSAKDGKWHEFTFNLEQGGKVIQSLTMKQAFLIIDMLNDFVLKKEFMVFRARILNLYRYIFDNDLIDFDKFRILNMLNLEMNSIGTDQIFIRKFFGSFFTIFFH
jgi:hypothetical protein